MDPVAPGLWSCHGRSGRYQRDGDRGRRCAGARAVSGCDCAGVRRSSCQTRHRHRAVGRLTKPKHHGAGGSCTVGHLHGFGTSGFVDRDRGTTVRCGWHESNSDTGVGMVWRACSQGGRAGNNDGGPPRTAATRHQSQTHTTKPDAFCATTKILKQHENPFCQFEAPAASAKGILNKIYFSSFDEILSSTIISPNCIPKEPLLAPLTPYGDGQINS